MDTTLITSILHKLQSLPINIMKEDEERELEFVNQKVWSVIYINQRCDISFDFALQMLNRMNVNIPPTTSTDITDIKKKAPITEGASTSTNIMNRGEFARNSQNK